jgi:hypothetical protein
MEQGVVRELPTGRLLSVDERGVGLRLTWRLDHGFLNLSLWRDDRCVETFHLRPDEAARLVSFLVHGLADATASSVAARPPLVALAPAAPTARARLLAGARRLQDRVAAGLDRAAAALRR